MEKEKYNYLLKTKTISDLALVGYMTFLNEKGLLNEGQKYVEGFIASLSKEEFEDIMKRNEDALEQARIKYDTAGSTGK